MRGRRLRVAMVLVGLGAGVLAGCAENLNFVEDQRVEITAPEDRADLRLPVTIRWTVDDFDVGPSSGSFAIFVDRPPQPPGRTLKWIFRDDPFCRGRPGCPDEAYLSPRGIYETIDTEYEITVIPALTSDEDEELHRATIVLLDERGRRVGEGAWTVEFRLPKES